MPTHRLRIIAAMGIAVAALACSDQTTSVESGPSFPRIRLVITNPGDTIYVRRFADCTVFDSAVVAGGAVGEVAETLRVNVGAAATITASFVDFKGNQDPVAHSGAYKFVIGGLKSKVGTLTWTSNSDFSGTLTGSALTNPPATK